MGQWGPAIYLNGIKVMPHIDTKIPFRGIEESHRIDDVVLLDSGERTKEEAKKILDHIKIELIGITVGELSDKIAIGRILHAFKHHL